MKTFKNIKNLIITSLAIFAIASCTDRFEELNTKNDLVLESLVDVNLIFTKVQFEAIKEGTPNGYGTIGNYSGMSYSGANAPFIEGQSTDEWDDSYQDYTNNLAAIIRITNDEPDLVNKNAIARIMKVWAFAKVTDTYGDIPYFESNLAPLDVIFTPKYDTQKSIYEDFFKELKEAALALDGTKVSYGGADLVYGGDVDKWRKFANSLRLRLALRVRYADEAMAIDNMSDLQASDLILSREDDASMYTTTDVLNNQNALYNGLLNVGGGDDFNKRTAGAIINKMDEFNDPRIKIFADTAMATFPKNNPDYDYFGYRGRPILGLVTVEYKKPWGQQTSSLISDFFYVPVVEIPIIRSSEMHFALAEAALFGLKAGDAQAHYKQGIEDAMNWTKDLYNNAKGQMPEILKLMYFETEETPPWTDADIDILLAHKEITMAESDAFLNSSIAMLSGSNEQQLEQIIVQKNIALFPLEYQNWAEWRRTGYPILQIGPDADVLNGVIPRRMGYPFVESTINNANYSEAVSRLTGGDSRLSKMWWDANPNVPYPWTGDPLPTMDTDYPIN
ncbi:MAG: SusD/RagB family nutrient-binding outer membrane lipoprotein [Flavobacteriaceae bacterium]|nr:SusD/RagB family nutrient-binding outer membrane lipoprotein [Flavobacteriaceae bacterium]